MTSLNLSEYSTKSFVLRGNTPDDTRDRRIDLKKMGGRFNSRLKHPSGVGTLPGWIYPRTKIGTVKAYVSTVNNGFKSIDEDGDDVCVEHPLGLSGSDTEEMVSDAEWGDMHDHELRIFHLERLYADTQTWMKYCGVTLAVISYFLYF